MREQLPDRDMTCTRCGKVVPFRFQPFPDAGLYWRCSECGEDTANADELGVALAKAMHAANVLGQEINSTLDRLQAAHEERDALKRELDDALTDERAGLVARAMRAERERDEAMVKRDAAAHQCDIEAARLEAMTRERDEAVARAGRAEKERDEANERAEILDAEVGELRYYVERGTKRVRVANQDSVSCRARLREAAQILIEEIGASGSTDAEDAAKEAVRLLQEARTIADNARNRVRELKTEIKTWRDLLAEEQRRSGVEQARVVELAQRYAGVQRLLNEAIRQRDEARGEVARLTFKLEDKRELHEGRELDRLRRIAENERLRAEVEGLRHLVGRLLKSDRMPDHACEECVPGGEIVIPGRRCAIHEARALLAEPKPREENEE